MRLLDDFGDGAPMPVPRELKPRLHDYYKPEGEEGKKEELEAPRKGAQEEEKELSEDDGQWRKSTDENVVKYALNLVGGGGENVDVMRQALRNMFGEEKIQLKNVNDIAETLQEEYLGLECKQIDKMSEMVEEAEAIKAVEELINGPAPGGAGLEEEEKINASIVEEVKEEVV